MDTGPQSTTGLNDPDNAGSGQARSVPRDSLEVDGLPTPRRHYAMAAVFCAVALSVISLSSVSVALPVIAEDLGVPPAAAIAIVNLFQLALLATLLPFAALGERIGYRRVFLAGLFVMGFASLACALATELRWLVLARIFQALAGAAIMAMNPALLRLSVPAAHLGRVLGLSATVVAVFTALGPSIAALVLAAASWHWLFLLNLPWIIAALWIGLKALPTQRGTVEQPYDGKAALLNMAFFIALFSGLRQLADDALQGMALIVLAAFLLYVLLRHQQGKPAPLLPLDLLAIPVVRLAVCASLCAFAAQLAALVALPFLLHHNLGRSMTQTGLLIMAWPSAVALMATAAAWLLERFASATLCIAGGLILALSLGLLSIIPPGAGNGTVLSLLVLSGIGFGLFQTPNNRSMIGATPRARSGSAGGMQATARLCGQTLGTTVAAMAFVHLPQNAASATLAAATLLAIGAAAFSLLRHRLPA